MHDKLIGKWNSDQSDEATRISIGNVKMTFTKDGKLIYDINVGDKVERMNLVYKIHNDIIITDQPSHPQEQKSKFTIEENIKLILEFEGEKTVFLRTPKKVQSLFSKIF